MLKGFLNKDERCLIWRKLDRYDMEMIQCAYNTQRRIPRNDSFILHVCTYGYLDLLTLIPLYDLSISFDCIEMATIYGHLPILQWVIVNNLLKNGNWLQIGEIAATHAQIHIIEWLINVGNSKNLLYLICRGAIEGGHIHIIEMMMHCGYDIHHISLWEIVMGDVKVVEYFLKMGRNFRNGSDLVSKLCTHGGKVDTILWLIKKGYSTDIPAYRRIARIYHREDILKCLEGL